MPPSTNINTYVDIAAILEAALPQRFATYRLATPGKARHWMQRAYKYRLLLQKQAKDASNVKGWQPPTPYDSLRMTLVGNAVELDFYPVPEGTLTTPDGQVLRPEEPTRFQPPPPKAERKAPAPFAPRTASEDFNNLADAAEELLRQHGGDDD